MKKIDRLKRQIKVAARREASAMRAGLEADQSALRSMSPADARRGFRAIGVPRFLYKYRSVPRPDDDVGVQQLRDLLVETRLWLASAPTLNDPFDSHIEHNWKLQGEEARKEWMKFIRSTYGISSAKAAALVPSHYVADPAKTRAVLNRIHRELAEQVGVCSFSSTARNTQLWSYYADSNHGFAVQYAPALDPAGLFARRINYTADPVVVEGFGVGGDMHIVDLLLMKGIDWGHEKEWRVIDPGHSNYALALRPEALTGLILGLNIQPAALALLRSLLDERRRRYLPMPRVYRVKKPAKGQRLRVESCGDLE